LPDGQSVSFDTYHEWYTNEHPSQIDMNLWDKKGHYIAAVIIPVFSEGEIDVDFMKSKFKYLESRIKQ